MLRFLSRKGIEVITGEKRLLIENYIISVKGIEKLAQVISFTPPSPAVKRYLCLHILKGGVIESFVSSRYLKATLFKLKSVRQELLEQQEVLFFKE